MLNLKEGLAAFEAKDYARAFTLIKPIAEQGDAVAQSALASMYQLGLGVEANSLEAVKWYVLSSQQGYGVASNNLAGMLLAGYDGVAPDKTEAEKWYGKAKEQGFLHAPARSDYLA